MARDQNGEKLTRDVQHEPDGSWSALVWFGDNPATNITRYFYTTREAARKASITDANQHEQPEEWLRMR